MNIFTISFKNMKAKPLSVTLNVVLFATGIFIISFLLMIQEQLTSHLEKNTAGIDLVVGAKGSPLQLILSNIYHIDYPTGNIKLAEAEKLRHNPLIKKTIPLALGDSYQGFRIVGTNHDYAGLFNGELLTGSLWNNDFDVSIGAKVAESSNLKLGDTFYGVHGFMAEGTDQHKEFNYKVTGIFKETGTVLDQLILTNVASVWKIHGHHHHHHDGSEIDGDEHEDHHDAATEEEHHEETDTAKEITSLLVFYRNPMGAVVLPRTINKQTNMQAASPALEINRLYSLLGIGIESVSMIAYLIIIISAFSIFISLFNSMKERQYELALMRVMGGSKIKLFAIIETEGILIAMTGYFVGLFFSRMGILFISSYAENTFHYGLNNLFAFKGDIMLLLTSLIVGFFASFLPALKAMNTDISRTLAK